MTPEGNDGGLGGELLQISPEEQRRAARIAALFSEEELTRFLQTMLRTFDELGYRQEQRFHFELGLLKLVHLRRLLPVEEVLSSLSGGTRATASKPAPGPVGLPRPAAPAPPSGPPKPAFSPFEQDKSRRKYDGIQGGMSVSPVVATQPMIQTESTVRVPEPVAAPAPAPAPRAGARTAAAASGACGDAGSLTPCRRFGGRERFAAIGRGSAGKCKAEFRRRFLR